MLSYVAFVLILIQLEVNAEVIFFSIVLSLGKILLCCVSSPLFLGLNKNSGVR